MFKNCFVSFESSFMDHSHSSPSLFSATCMRSASDLSEPMASQVTSETLLETFEIFGKRRMHCQAKRPTCPTLKWQNFEVLRKRDKSKQTETKDMSRSLAKRNIETGSKLVPKANQRSCPWSSQSHWARSSSFGVSQSSVGRLRC